MLELRLHDITLTILQDGENVRVHSEFESILLQNQNIPAVTVILEENFTIVLNYYSSLSGADLVTKSDMTNISVSIVLSFLYLYNNWRIIDKHQRNRDLKFALDDLQSPAAHDIIFAYFKKHTPRTWKERSAQLLRLDMDAFERYYKNRERFYNR